MIDFYQKMVIVGSLQLSHEFGLCRNHRSTKQYKSLLGRSKLHSFNRTLSLNISLRRQDSWSSFPSDLYRPILIVPCRSNAFKCHSFQVPSHGFEVVSTALTRSYTALQRIPLVFKMAPAVGLIIFALWGFMPLVRQSRSVLHDGDSGWEKSSTRYVTTSYVQPLLLWTGALLVCRALDPVVLPTAASQLVKQRLLNFVRSLSTVLAFAYCLSSLIEQTQKYFMETGESGDARNMGFQFAGKAIYSGVWVAAASLFMELLGFSTQKWLTAGGLGTVLLTLAGREIFTNFLSSAMIHATRPFIVNEWIQTKIEGYDVSGTVEHVGWWSPTIVRGEDREAVHIPNHKFTMNVVRNLTQKTHWRIKTHLAISHLDVHKISNIVSDMRKVLSKNPQIEQQKLHRRVFLDNINPENQALLIMISCFVKTSHFEEYLRVKEGILQDLLRVISYHRARLATPIRTVQKIYDADSFFKRGGFGEVDPDRPLKLLGSKINGEDKAKSRAQDGKTNGRPTADIQADPKAAATATTPKSDSKSKGTPTTESKGDAKIGEPSLEAIKAASASTSTSDSQVGDKVTAKATLKSAHVETASSDPKVLEPVSADLAQNKKIFDSKQVKNSPPSQAADTDKAGVFRESLPSQEGERSPVSQPAVSRPTLEENIVLGVALEGSKRTLPIEEEPASPSTPEVKELTAAHRNGNGSASEKDKKDGQIPAGSKSSSDHRDEPER